MRIVYFSSDGFGLPLLEALAGGHLIEIDIDLAAVVTTPPAPSGRGMEVNPTVIEQRTRSFDHDIPLFAPERLKGNDEFLAEMRELEPDMLLVASYGKLITAPYLDLTRWPLCFHPSPLPELRGPSPVRTAILEGWEETALSLFAMTEELDEGPVLLKHPVAIGPEQTFGELNEELAELTVEVFDEATDQIQSGEAVLTEQDESEATFTEKFDKRDTYLDFTRPAVELHNKIRAFNPDLGTACKFRGDRLKIWRSRGLMQGVGPEERDYDLAPGELKVTEDDELLCGTGENLLELVQVQPAGKQRMNAYDFLNGYQPDGEVLEPIEE